jgi:hypothetical protein
MIKKNTTKFQNCYKEVLKIEFLKPFFFFFAFVINIVILCFALLLSIFLVLIYMSSVILK